MSAFFRTPVISSAVPIVVTDPKSKFYGCATDYFQRTLLSISEMSDMGAGASQDYSGVIAQISTINGQISTINTSLAGKVNKSTFSTYGTPTGTLDRTTFATYTAPTASASYSQSEMQAVMNHLQVLSRHLAAVITDLKT